MKQYKKGRPPAIQLFECKRKAVCKCSPFCGNECKLTSHVSWAKKDRFGKPVKDVRFIRSGKGGA